MNGLLNYIIAIFKSFDIGTLPNFPDPDPPADLGTDLTQDDKDFIKKLKKEFERFNAGPPA